MKIAFFVLLALVCVSANYYCLYEGTTCSGTKLAGQAFTSTSCTKFLFSYGDTNDDEFWLASNSTAIGGEVRKFALPGGSSAQCQTQNGGPAVCLDVGSSQSIKICDSSATSIGMSVLVMVSLIVALL